MPGVQKPHCSPCISRKPSCIACRVPSALAMPSMVRISTPFACTANILHARSRRQVGEVVHDIRSAGATMAGLAANMRASEIELFAQEVNQERARLDQSFDTLAVHFQFDLRLSHHSLPQPRARDLARSSARASMTPAILVRYCAGPRASLAGDVIASAATTACLTVGAASGDPVKIFSASCAQSGVSATLVKPIEQLSTLPPFMVNITAAAAVA